MRCRDVVPLLYVVEGSNIHVVLQLLLAPKSPNNTIAKGDTSSRFIPKIERKIVFHYHVLHKFVTLRIYVIISFYIQEYTDGLCRVESLE